MPGKPASRRGAVIAGGVLAAVTLLGFAAPLLPGASPDMLRHELAWAAGAWWGPIAGVALFALLAIVGAPQIVLITALVLVFGGSGGFVYSMAGKLVACGLGFAVGRGFGTQILARYETRTLSRVMAWLSSHGFWASAAVRLVPTVPSVIVNIAAGATPMRFAAFLAGTALGSVPKMAAIAFGGEAAAQALEGGSTGSWIALGLAVLAWLVIALLGRRLLRRWRAEDAADAEPCDDAATAGTIAPARASSS